MELNPEDVEIDPVRSKLETNIAKDPGIKHYEIYFSISSELSLEMEKGSMKKSTTSKDVGFGIRVANDQGQSAFSNASAFDADSIQKTVRNVVSLMEKSTPDEDFQTFAKKSSISQIQSKYLFDKEIECLNIENAVNFMADTLEDAEKIQDARVYSINVDFGAGNETVYILNSNGVDVSENYTAISATCSVTVKDGGEMSSDYEYKVGRSLDQVSPGIGMLAVEKALKTLEKVHVKTEFYPTILSQRAAARLIGLSFARAANGELMQQGLSFLHDNLGQEIGPGFLSVVDDGQMTSNSRINTRSFDSEGFKTDKKAIINAGKFETGLHNSYTANKANIESTGNARRTGYNSPPAIGASNVIIEVDTGNMGSFEELLSCVKRGIYFDETFDSPNYATGDFSGMISLGFLIEDGEITKPISQAAFGIHLLELLNSIKMCGDDPKDNGGIIAPSILLEGLHVSGSL
ncbi:MAG: TldD/PmbA family protein [Candidatus Hodarchaeota archaeon]